MGEVRYSSLTRTFPEDAEALFQKAKKDMKDAYEIAGQGNVEILFRDLYDVNGDISRLRKWVDMTKSVFGI